MVTHGNLLANITALATRLDCNEYDVLVSWLPPYHDMGLIGALMMPLYAGMEVVLFSPLEFMKRPLRWLRTIQRYKATVSPAPNFAFDLCTRKSTEENRGALDLSTWRVAAVSAEPISANTLGRFAAAFSPSGFRSEAFVPCYGLAEATLIVTGASVGSGARKLPLDEEGLRAGHVRHPSGDARTQAVVACGAAVDGVRVEVVRPETRESLPERQIGEVWIAGPTICAGYFGRLQETESTFRAKLLDDRTPFLRTGDLGFLDNGELFVVGRKKDLIIVRARKHYPQDIEHTVEQSHDVVRPGCCAAFSIPVDDAEALVVVAEIDPRRCDRSMVATVEELAAVAVDTIRANVAENHALKVHDLVFLKLGSIPKTSSGKIRRTACREAYAAGTLQRASFLERSENRSAEATLANDDGGHRNG
jgi:acyl-CoA synthetase (AMP-forming)/AMP-acid ligase II